MLLFNVALLIVGFVALVKGADFFVDGSSALAKIFKVSGVIIGLTVVSMGTSLPELAVSTSAAIAGSNEIALSNVVGSNIFNLLVVLGVCAVIHRVPVDSVIIKRDFPISIFIALVVFCVTGLPAIIQGKLATLTMADNAGMVYRALGISLLLMFVCYIAYLIYDAKKHPNEEEAIKSMPLFKCVLLIIIGVALIILGGQAVVESAKFIAKTFGMTETLIGLTVVALGTSLPELVTSIVAARKGEVEMAVGNVVGSNIFNILFILGVSTSIHPIAVNTASVYDMMILIAVSLMTWGFAIKGKSIGRLGGAIMLLCYIASTTFAILR